MSPRTPLTLFGKKVGPPKEDGHPVQLSNWVKDMRATKVLTKVGEVYRNASVRPDTVVPLNVYLTAASAGAPDPRRASKASGVAIADLRQGLEPVGLLGRHIVSVNQILWSSATRATPRTAANDKDFAPWAPREGDTAAGAYLEGLTGGVSAAG